jgi:Peptidoglycan-binding protein, CsiV
MRRCAPVLALLGASALVSSQAAQPAPLYRVEVIVFRATVALGSSEDWAAESSAAGLAAAAASEGQPSTVAPSTNGGEASSAPPSASSATPAAPSPAQLSHLDLLPPSDFELDRTAARLRASSRYVLLAHAAWTQLASPWGQPIEIPIGSLGLAAPGLAGSIALERGQFLHLDVELHFAESDPPPGLGAAPGTVFVLDQIHRMWLNERGYFDHPAFGVIALVTLVKAPSGAAR